MSKKITSLIVAASIALSSFSATAASAGHRDRNGRIIVGTIALGTLLAIASEHDRNKRKSHAAPAPQPRYKAPPRAKHPQQTHRKHKRPQPQRSHAQSRKALPASCRTNYRTRSGTKTLYSGNCLQRTYRHVNRLPHSCYFNIRTHHGMRAGFGQNCLSRHGYRAARY